MKSPNLNSSSDDIKAYFSTVYKKYESLFGLLTDEKSFYLKPNTLRHPLIFYYGHTATFFINKLNLAKITNKRINPQLEAMFAVGVDEMSWDDLDESNYQWSTVAQTQEYRDSVYSFVNNLMDTLPPEDIITKGSPWWVILMCIEHENIHIETSAVLIRELPLENLIPSTEWDYCKSWGEAPINSFVDIPKGDVDFCRDKRYYSWDNEYGEHKAIIPKFKASKYLVSNREFLEFIRDDGYIKKEFWSREGWSWREFSKALYPHFWVEEDNQYMLRTLTNKIPLPMNWAVEVNYLEAEAFCAWLSFKMKENITVPTEDEYFRLLNISENLDNANLNLSKYASSMPINSFKNGELYGVVGDVWQWSRTPIYPFSGFEIDKIYDDFTIPTFDGKHNLIKGGSWASCGNVASAYSRYAFRRHFFQFAGFRYVCSSYQEDIKSHFYIKEILEEKFILENREDETLIIKREIV